MLRMDPQSMIDRLCRTADHLPRFAGVTVPARRESESAATKVMFLERVERQGSGMGLWRKLTATRLLDKLMLDMANRGGGGKELEYEVELRKNARLKKRVRELEERNERLEKELREGLAKAEKRMIDTGKEWIRDEEKGGGDD